MRDQVEERLEYLQTGKKPQRNIEVMRQASKEADAVSPKKVAMEDDTEMVSEKKKKKKKHHEELEMEEEPVVKKSKKNKHLVEVA
jgi:hypothetical protein